MQAEILIIFTFFCIPYFTGLRRANVGEQDAAGQRAKPVPALVSFSDFRELAELFVDDLNQRGALLRGELALTPLSVGDLVTGDICQAGQLGYVDDVQPI